MQLVAFRCEPLTDAQPQALGFTYRFEAPAHGEPGSVSIRFTGRRLGVKGRRRRSDSFSVVETVDGVIPGSGELAVTVRVYDVAAGEWEVSAAPIAGRRQRPADTAPDRCAAQLPSASTSGTTGYAPAIRVKAPGARLGAWPGLVAVGAAVALTTEATLARRAQLSTARVLPVSVVAAVVGLVGAKAYYLVEHRSDRARILDSGLCIQGFVLGAASTLVAGGLATDVPVGRLLDVATPGMLFGMAIGRWGCFLGGCCAGRMTRSSWGMWSSDRRLGARRVPTQLMESAVALAVGVASLLALRSPASPPEASVFLAAVAVYTLGRQILLPLRDLPRHAGRGRVVTTTVAALVLAADVAVTLMR